MSGIWNTTWDEVICPSGSETIAESGIIGFQFDFYEPDNAEFKNKRDEGGVFFSHTEEVDKDGKATYRNPNDRSMSWDSAIVGTGVLSDISGSYSPGGAGLGGSGVLCIPVGT